MEAPSVNHAFSQSRPITNTWPSKARVLRTTARVGSLAKEVAAIPSQLSALVGAGTGALTHTFSPSKGTGRQRCISA